MKKRFAASAMILAMSAATVLSPLTAFAEAEEQELNIAIFQGGYGDAYWNQMVELFEKSHEGVKVNMTISPTIGDIIRPQYVSGDAVVDRCIIGEGAEIYGEVHNSVIGADVRIEKGVVVRDSIIMRHSTIGEGTQVNKAIIAENVHVGKHVVMGVGEEAPNVLKPNIYGFGLVTVGEKAVIPDGVTIGKNVCISGETSLEDYPDGTLPSGGAIVEKDGE